MNYGKLALALAFTASAAFASDHLTQIAGYAKDLHADFAAMAQTLVQLNAPEQSRGRVIGLFNMASLGLRAFAGVTVGLLGGVIGIHWSLAASAAALLLLAAAMLGWHLRQPAMPPTPRPSDG